MSVRLPDGKIARTQPEQVKKNMDDIESINNELDIIKEGIASAYKIQGSEDVADLNALEKAEEMNGYVYNMLDAGNLVNEDASTLSVQIGDNVVFVWNSGDWYWDRLAGLVDTSNLCTLDTVQTVSGLKTFSNGIVCQSIKDIDLGVERISYNGGYVNINANLRPSTNGTRDLGYDTLRWKDLYLSGKIFNSGFIVNNGSADTFKVDGVNGECKTLYTIQPFTDNGCNLGKDNIRFDTVFATSLKNNYSSLLLTTGSDLRLQVGNNCSIVPTVSNNVDLGKVNLLYKDLYLAGSLKDGTNSVAVADIPKKVLFVAATHAPSTSGAITVETRTLSAAEMALIDTSKPIILSSAWDSGYTDACLGILSYNTSTGVITFLQYGTGATTTCFYILQ